MMVSPPVLDKKLLHRLGIGGHGRTASYSETGSVFYSPKEPAHRHSDKGESMGKLRLFQLEEDEPDPPEESAFRDDYEVGQLIGQGATSCVYAAKKKNTSTRYAVKIIPSKTILSDSFRSIAREIQILKRLHHPNVITLHDAIITSKNLYIIMDLLRGPELFDVIVDRKFFPELEARALIRKILKAVAYMHSENIAHRDIKPENIKFETSSLDSDLKILDFGFARHLNTNEILQNQVGTISYEAPEILKGCHHSFSVDVWAVGIIAYIMLCGFPPFFSSFAYQNDSETLQRYPFWLFFNEDTPYLRNSIIAGKYTFPDPYWINITQEGKDLITKLLTVDPAERITAEQALNHMWFKVPTESFVLPESPDQANLQNFIEDYQNPRDILSRFLARRPSAKELEELHVLVHHAENPTQVADRIVAKQNELYMAERRQSLNSKLKHRLTPLNSPILRRALHSAPLDKVEWLPLSISP